MSILLVFPAGRSAGNDLNVLHVLADKYNLLIAHIAHIARHDVSPDGVETSHE